MATTYETIKSLPGKSTNWRGLVDALVANYLAVYAAAHNGKSPYAPHTTDEWAAAKGVRQLRDAAMQVACSTVHALSIRSSFIPPSPETLQWGGFLGGEALSWTDRDAEEQATAAVISIIRRAA